MKKGILGVLLCVLLSILTGCQNTEKGSTDYQVYYINSYGTKLVEELFTPAADTPKTITEELLERMDNPSVGNDHTAALPQSVAIQKCHIGDNQIALDFSKEYYELDPVREILVRAAYVKTLVQVPQVEAVVITVDGEPLVDQAGETVGALKADSFIDAKGDAINSYQYASLTLYFPSADGTQIVREMRNVHYSSNTTLEKVVVEQLLKGPVNTKLQAIASSSTKILGVSMMDGICTVNLDSTFNQTPEGSTVTSEAAIYSIVDALSDVCHVDGVVIQIEGISEVAFREEFNLNETLVRNPDIIQPVAAEDGAVMEPSVGGDTFLKDYFF